VQVTGAVGWRKDSIKYKKNEVFLDIVEQVNLLTSSKGSVLRCDVNGKIVMKVFLSGMPDVKLGLNDKLEVRRPSHHYWRVIFWLQQRWQQLDLSNSADDLCP
jgi:hypothetical protein